MTSSLSNVLPSMAGPPGGPPLQHTPWVFASKAQITRAIAKMPKKLPKVEKPSAEQLQEIVARVLLSKDEGKEVKTESKKPTRAPGCRGCF